MFQMLKEEPFSRFRSIIIYCGQRVRYYRNRISSSCFERSHKKCGISSSEIAITWTLLIVSRLLSYHATTVSFTLSQRETEELARCLRSEGIDADFYHARRTPEQVSFLSIRVLDVFTARCRSPTAH